jgi:hypothetical protein
MERETMVLKIHTFSLISRIFALHGVFTPWPPMTFITDNSSRDQHDDT